MAKITQILIAFVLWFGLDFAGDNKRATALEAKDCKPIVTIDCLQAARKSGYDAHNEFRALHNSDPLTPDAELEGIAQAYADKILNQGLSLVHSGQAGLGENLFAFVSSSAYDFTELGRNASTSWYMEICKYDYEKNIFSAETGHFTQLVWKGSTKIGLGIAMSSQFLNAVVVANYKPQGNIEGSFGQNVQKPSSTAICGSSSINYGGIFKFAICIVSVFPLLVHCNM